MKSIKILKIYLIIFFILFVNCSTVVEKRKNFLFFGNVNVEIVLFGEKDFDFEKIFKSVEDTLKKLDNFFSKYNKESYVYRFNSCENFIEKNDEFLKLLTISDSLKRLTDGYFNVFIEPLLSYYKRCEQQSREPVSDSIRFFVELINQNNQVILKKDKIYKKNKYVSVDFGGIAKGYFGDLVKEMLLKNGIKKALINLGGDIVCFNYLDNKPFKIGVRSFKDDSIVKVEELSNGSIVTSGDYFRFYTIKGKKYCHIVDPKTGNPASKIHSVTVIADNGSLADCLATVLMIVSENKRKEILKTFSNVKTYFQN
ncbi:MAG: FAD:protein FMN transferase [candidate division WOR-3 bacterium]